MWKTRVRGEGSSSGDESCLSHVVFEEMVIHTVGNIQHEVRKSELGTWKSW